MKDLAQALQACLASSLPQLSDLRVELAPETMKTGFSAETILFDALWLEHGVTKRQGMVLRRQLVGYDLTPDADLRHQGNVMTALSRHSDLPVPKLVVLETGETELGGPYLVMERLPGRIVPQNPNYNLTGWVADLPVEQRARVWLNGIAAMARVHRLDWRDGFSFLDRTGRGDVGLPQYLGWVRNWLEWALDGRAHPTAEAAMDWLERSMPSNAPVSLLWGDSIPANQLFDADSEVCGIIDWEFAALAPGELDLAWWLYFDDLFSIGFHVPRLEGLPTRAEMVQCYERAVGRPVADLDYYLALAGLRMTIVSIRAVDRLVAQGRFKSDNDAWKANPSAVWLARHLSLESVQLGPDFAAFSALLFGKH